MNLKELKMKRQKLNEKKAAAENQSGKIIFSNKEEFEEFYNSLKNKGASETVINDLMSNYKNNTIIIPDLKTETLRALIEY